MPEPTDRIGQRELKNNPSKAFAAVRAGGMTAVTNRNRVEAYLVSPARLEALEESDETLQRLRGTLPLLMAAVEAGAAIPSQTLDDLGLDRPFDWRALNAFAARYPVRMTHGEDGESLPDLPPVRHTPVGEDDSDF